MKKLALKLYDKLIISLLFSTFLMSGCKDPNPPAPEYGIQPMYGVIQTSTIIKNHTPQNPNTLKK